MISRILYYDLLNTGGEPDNLTESGARAARNLFNESAVRKETFEPAQPVAGRLWVCQGEQGH